MHLTEAERSTGLDDRRLADLRAAIDIAGFVVLENAVPPDVVAKLRDAVHEQREIDRTYITFKTTEGRDTEIGCTFFPWVPPFDRQEVVAHPVVLQMVGGLIEDPVSRIYNTNLSKPGSVSQPVHVDVGTILEDGTPRVHPNISVQVLLCDFTVENGSTELWPGTHRHPCRKSDTELIARLAAEIPSVRANHPAGTIIMRETAVWHRGVANRTSTWREMLSLNFVPGGTFYADATFGRPLELRTADLEGLPPRARRVWAPNVVTPSPSA